MLRVQSQETKRSASAVRAAVNADKKGWREFVQHLDNLWRDLERAANRPVIDGQSFVNGLSKLKARARR